MAHRRGRSGLAASLALAIALVACAPGAPATPAASGPPGAPSSATAPPASAELQALPALPAVIEAARQEGQLSFLWSGRLFGGEEGLRRITEGMNSRYGLATTIQYTPGVPSVELTRRLISEHQAGRPNATDIVSTPVADTVTLIRAEALLPVDWPSWAPSIQDPSLFGARGMAVESNSYLPGITYSSSRVTGAAVPRSMEDLLKPEYRGRIASTPPATWFNYLGAPEIWGAQRMLDYISRFSDQVAGLIGCSDKERLVIGEFDLFAIDCSNSETMRLHAQGQPIDFVLPSDLPVLGTRYVSIPRRAPHPATAKLWIDYLLSREGQDLLYEVDNVDNVRIPGSNTARDVAALQAGGRALVHVDLDFYARNDEAELDRLRALTQQIIRKQ